MMGVKVLKVILFACTQNSFRSQIAEAYFNKFAPKGWTAISAGIRPADTVHFNAIQLMREEGKELRKSIIPLIEWAAKRWFYKRKMRPRL